jgi:hypothetical protein
MLKRREYLVDLTDPNRDLIQDGRQETAEGQGNLYSSKLAGQEYHCPTLDIDLECELHESTTPGHFHLYIDRPMPWESYVRLLEALYEADIIQKGYYELSIARGATFLRKPGVKKGPDDAVDS